MYSLIETSARIPASILKNDCLHCNGTNAGTISMIWCPKCSIYGSALPSLPLFGEAKRPVAKMIDFARKSPVPVRIRKKSPCLFIALISQETISFTPVYAASMRRTSRTEAACSLAAVSQNGSCDCEPFGQR